MRKAVCFCLSLLLMLGLCACRYEEPVQEEKQEEPPLTVTVDPGNSMAETPEDTPPSGETASDVSGGAAVPQGGILTAKDGKAVFLSQQGGIALADQAEGSYRYLSSDMAAEVYFDGRQAYYTGDDGIFAVDPEGESRKISEHLSYKLWIEGDKIFYIRQTDLSSELPFGELWCMDTDGGGAVLILGTHIKGDFCIKDGWIYYISADDGALYRSMLYGSQIVKLADGPAELCFVTERGVYYKEKKSTQNLRRIDLRTNTNLSLGAYGEIVAAGDTIAVMARRELHTGGLHNLFSLMVFDETAGELVGVLDFENIGADSLAWLEGDYVYMYRAEGGTYRMALSDASQTKEVLFEGDTVFSDGCAWHIGGNGPEVYDCATGEVTVIEME